MVKFAVSSYSWKDFIRFPTDTNQNREHGSVLTTTTQRNVRHRLAVADAALGAAASLDCIDVVVA